MTDEPEIDFLDHITCKDCGVTGSHASGPMLHIRPEGTWICEPCFYGNYDDIGRCMLERGVTSPQEAARLLAEERERGLSLDDEGVEDLGF